jgi:molecular chaperone GrpE
MHGESRTKEPESEGVAGAQSAESAPASTESSAQDTAADPAAEIARLRDAWLRSAADFDNFRKRTRREIEEARRSEREDVVRTLLPVFDNLERALQSASRSSDKAMAEGLSMVQRQFVDALGRVGIARVATVGLVFDPSVHEAIQQVETSDHSAGTVIAEVQPGYTLGERLLRAAMVVVARPKSSDGEERISEPTN